MTDNYPKLDHAIVDLHKKFGQLLSNFILKILSGNKILTSIKGLYSIKILQKMFDNNPKLDLINVDVHTKFGQILSNSYQDMEMQRNSDINQVP